MSFCVLPKTKIIVLLYKVGGYPSIDNNNIIINNYYYW